MNLRVRGALVVAGFLVLGASSALGMDWAEPKGPAWQLAVVCFAMFFGFCLLQAWTAIMDQLTRRTTK